MAARMSAVFLNALKPKYHFCNHVLHKHLFYNQGFVHCCRLLCTTKTTISSKPCVVISDDGRTLICWHPEQDFPYEYSKPMPSLPQELIEEDSVLKVQHRMDSLKRFKPKGPSDKELSEITYTFKSQWYPLARRFKRPKLPPGEDREGI